jgi:hypothetical protein
MIDAVFEPGSQAETSKSFYRGRCDGPMVTKKFQLPVELKRWKLMDQDQEKTWEQR